METFVDILREQTVKVKVEHPGILEVPEGKEVDDLPLDHFVKLANKKDTDGDFNLIGTMKYKGRSKIQSWTSRMYIAKEFANRAWVYNDNAIVIKYKFKENDLLFNTKFLNNMAISVGLGIEEEIIRIENKPINVEVYKKN